VTKIILHKEDIPSFIEWGKEVAIDTETLGLNNFRDRLCLVQITNGDGTVHLVKFSRNNYECENLKKLLTNPLITKIFHFARFDIAAIKHYLKVLTQPVFCTKIASKIARTYTDHHGLKELCRELLGVHISKQQQSSYWGSSNLSKDQQQYAANDVIHLHELKSRLIEMLERENRLELAQNCIDFLPHRANLDLAGWTEDIFSHH
jgi:ribonuclease D